MAPVSYGEATKACYRHPDRLAGAVCRRCDRPICPECMRDAPVGWQCQECVHRDSRQAPVVRWRPSSQGRLGGTRLAPAVIALIVVNVVVYLAASGDRASIDERFGVIPAGIHQGQWYRLVTGAFLHLDAEHILFNMVSLAIIGSPVEVLLGRTRFLALYLLAGIGGSVASYVFGAPNVDAIGASGAIFGLFGAYFVLARRRGFEIRTVSALIIINLVISFADPGIDWLGHLGGLVVGAAVALVFSATVDRRSPSARVVEVVSGAATLGVLALLVLLPPGHFDLMGLIQTYAIRGYSG
jgi:membrane associated rhomboid family serine protease